MYVVYGMFLIFKYWLCWKYQYNKYMFNFIDIYIFNSVSGCVGRAPVPCFAWEGGGGGYNAVKTALIYVPLETWKFGLRPWLWSPLGGRERDNVVK